MLLKLQKLNNYRTLRLFSTINPKFNNFPDLQAQQANKDNLPGYLNPDRSDSEHSESEEGEEHEVIKGMAEFKQAIKFEVEKNYDESEYYLKEGLKAIKGAGEEKSLGYQFLLKRLAYVSFQNKKYSESEKYFRIAANMIPIITQDPSLIFNSQKNLLTFYTHTNLDKAQEQVNKIRKDIQDSHFLPVHERELNLMEANISLLKEDFVTSKNLYRNALSMPNDDLQMSHILNNLAYSSWQHKKELQNKVTIPEMTEEKKNALKDESYIATWFKEAIFKNEQSQMENFNMEDMQTLEKLTAEGSVIPFEIADCRDQQMLESVLEPQYFNCVKSPQSGKILTNLSEFLMEALLDKKDDVLPRDVAFWFRLGLRYYEANAPDQMERHLVLLGLFYAANGKHTTAEGLYREAISKLESDYNMCYSLVMAKNLYGRLLLKDPKRENEATRHLKESEDLAKTLPYWWNHADHVFVQDFELK